MMKLSKPIITTVKRGVKGQRGAKGQSHGKIFESIDLPSVNRCNKNFGMIFSTVLFLTTGKSGIVFEVSDLVKKWL